MSQQRDQEIAELEQAAEMAIMEETLKQNLEFAELSPVIRLLLAKVYIRGAGDMIKKVRGIGVNT